VAYRYFSTRKRRFIIADTPGHEQYTRNMATGASTAELAVVLIDARLGVLTQSKRHGFIASLLGVPRLVVAVNKMDLVGYDRTVFERIKDEYTDFTTRLSFRDLTFIPVSALVATTSSTRAQHTMVRGRSAAHPSGECLCRRRPESGRFPFPVQRWCDPTGTSVGYSGKIASGVVRPGDEIVVLPSGKRSKVTRIPTFDGDLDYAFARCR